MDDITHATAAGQVAPAAPPAPPASPPAPGAPGEPQADEAAGAAHAEVLADVMEVVTRSLAEAGLPRETAWRTAFEVAEHLRAHWKGTAIYFPGEKRRELDRRDAQIVAEFHGDNWLDICRKHGISRGRIYQIIHEARRFGVPGFLPLGDDE